MSRASGCCDQASFAAGLADPLRPCPEGLRVWNGSDPTRRFDVYRNNVASSLVDALADTFPVVQQLVGEEFFRAMAAVFARAHRPRSPVLARYGADLPEFIEGFAPARDVPYLADVARLEYAWLRAYHAADADPVAADAVGAALASGERIGALRLELHPSLAIVASPYAIVSIWAAHHGEGDLAQTDPFEPETAFVARRTLDVLVTRGPRGSAEFVAALATGAPLADAAAGAADRVREFDLSAALTLLLRIGALTSIRLAPEPMP
jgi:hypothetical protein